VFGEKKLCQFWVTWAVAAATSLGAVPVADADAYGNGDADPVAGAEAGALVAGGAEVDAELLLPLEQEATSSTAPIATAAVRAARAVRAVLPARAVRVPPAGRFAPDPDLPGDISFMVGFSAWCRGGPPPAPW
jgi:hypothetical protein